MFQFVLLTVQTEVWPARRADQVRPDGAPHRGLQPEAGSVASNAHHNFLPLGVKAVANVPFSRVLRITSIAKIVAKTSRLKIVPTMWFNLPCISSTCTSLKLYHYS